MGWRWVLWPRVWMKTGSSIFGDPGRSLDVGDWPSLLIMMCTIAKVQRYPAIVPPQRVLIVN